MWHHYYGGIFIHWCLGYLEIDERQEFLKKAKMRLIKTPKSKKDEETDESFIFVLENIWEEGMEHVHCKG